MRLVMVTWHDAHGGLDCDLARDHKPVTMKTVGWLLKRDESGVMVAAEHYVEDGAVRYRDYTFIPAGMVVKVSRV